jgi:hypothetical protein
MSEQDERTAADASGGAVGPPAGGVTPPTAEQERAERGEEPWHGKDPDVERGERYGGGMT